MDGPPGPDADSAVVGGRYRLEGLLGTGGMADVHRATDLRLNRPVALKVFRPGTDPDGERRFHEEAQMLANLSHPGLVAVHDFGVEQHHAYLVMELVEGPTLREVLDRGPRPVGEVTRIGTDIADVLAYVHDRGVVHRDVKPSNVLSGRDSGRVRLADFGISRLVDSTRLTSAGTTVGTMSYMAPEQLRGDRVGPPADVYALGLLLLEAVTGRIEYSGESWEAAEQRISQPPAVPDDLPEPLRGTLLAMTETDPAARPSAGQVAAMLADPGDDRAAEQPPPPSRTGRKLLIAFGVVALLAIIAAFALAGGDDNTQVAEPSAPATAPEAPPVPPEDPAADDPAAEDPAAEDPAAEDPGGGGGFDLPDAPTFDPPDLPDLPDAPQLPDAPDLPEPSQDARNAWDRFVDWVSGLF